MTLFMNSHLHHHGSPRLEQRAAKLAELPVWDADLGMVHPSAVAGVGTRDPCCRVLVLHGGMT